MALYYDKDNNLKGRITHSDIVYELKQILGVSNDYRTRIIKYDSEPAQWKHACTYTGIGIQKPSVYSFVDGTTIKYTFCPVCKTIYYFLVTQGMTMQPTGYYNAGYNGNIGNFGYINDVYNPNCYNNGGFNNVGYNSNGYNNDDWDND